MRRIKIILVYHQGIKRFLSIRSWIARIQKQETFEIIFHIFDIVFREFANKPFKARSLKMIWKINHAKFRINRCLLSIRLKNDRLFLIRLSIFVSRSLQQNFPLYAYHCPYFANKDRKICFAWIEFVNIVQR